MSDELIKTLCKQYEIKLIDLAEYNVTKQTYIMSHCLRTTRFSKRQFKHNVVEFDGLISYGWCKKYCDEIYLGTFKSKEKRLATFLHELGHCINKETEFRGLYPEEVAAWKTGFAIARDHNIKFSRKTIRWCNMCLQSYSIKTATGNGRLRYSEGIPTGIPSGIVPPKPKTMLQKIGRFFLTDDHLALVIMAGFAIAVWVNVISRLLYR